MNKWILIPLILLLFSCKTKKKEEDVTAQFFPVLSFLKSQVAHVDTSLYRIIKITTVGSTTDTVYIPRENFKKEAKDFLAIPDITSEDLKEDYKETELYDESMQSVILSYLPTDEDAEIRRQEVIIQPSPQEGDKVKTIFIDRQMEEGKNSIRKNMLWQVDKRFQVTTITLARDGKEKVEKLQVIWNSHPSAE